MFVCLCVCVCDLSIVLKDIEERGRELDQILSQYVQLVKPAFEEFCLPVSKGLSLVLVIAVVAFSLSYS